MFLLRVLIPDRPGSLGTVASALGDVHADIEAIEIVERRADQTVVDDFIVSLPDGTLPDRLVSACQSVDGVSVLWFSRYTGAEGLRFDLELAEQMAQAPAHALSTFVSSLPKVLQSDWAALLTQNTMDLHTSATPEAGDLSALVGLELERAAPIPTPDALGETLVAGAPLGGGLVVIGRRGGPEYFDSEIARFGYLAHLAQAIAETR